MKKLVLFIFIPFSVLFFSGCSSGSPTELYVYEMESFTKVKEDSLISSTDLKIVKDFSKAFANAKKEPGIVNMTDPEYIIKLGDESYFLWISDEHGTIMNENDTHTIFTLSKKSVRNIMQILIKKDKENAQNCSEHFFHTYSDIFATPTVQVVC